MRMKLAVVIFVAVNLSAQPSNSERYKYAPLVATAKLWNTIRYLHPRLSGDSTAWDAALMAAIPKIEDSHSDEELAAALDTMLGTLHDACTHIAFGLPGKTLSVQTFESDTMVIHVGDGDLSGSMGAGLMLKLGIPQTSNLVWDLRGSRMPFRLASRPDLQQLRASGIGYAYRQHSGYAPPDGSGLRYYSSSLQMVDPHTSADKPAKAAWRQVYLVDKDSAIPVQAIIDQINGRTAILSEDPPRDLQAGFTELVSVLGKVVAEVRVAELRYADGTTEFAPTRVVLNRGEEAVKAAVGAISGSLGMPGERPKFQPGPSSFHDMPYAENPYPNREMRILAAIRMWGILRYFDPYLTQMGDKWDDVLVDLLPKFSNAKNAREYHLAVAEMAARTGDPGCTARSAETQDILGPLRSPFEIRFIENQPVIVQSAKSSPGSPGDIIVKIDGKPVQERIDELTRFIAAPIPLAARGQVSRFLLNTKTARSMNLTLRGKDDMMRDVAVTVNDAQTNIRASRTGDAIRLINERIGYADLERVEAAELDGMFDKFQHTSAIIFDLRGHPRNTVLAVAGRLADRNQPVLVELFSNLVGIGTNDRHIQSLQSELRAFHNAKARYAGKSIALIDDVTPSLTGETAMCLKVAANTVLIGKATFPTFSDYASTFDVPGGIKLVFSGQIPRWPGGKFVYPEGIRPDVEVQPTIAGIRQGRDEILEAAVGYLEKKN